MMTIDYSGQTVLVTGGTRGIGKATADLFYELGANTIVTGTKQSEIDSFNKTNQDPRKHFLQLDLASDTSFDSFTKDLLTFDRLDVCINNAGINIIETLEDAKLSDFNLIHKINVEGPFRIMQAILPKMRNNKYGRIVNIASIWGVITRPKRSMYATSKHALIGLTKTAAIEWAQWNILANCVSPGFTKTELTRNTNTQEQIEEIEEKIPIKRMAEPIEMAKAIAFLASSYNTYITGQNLTIDGGYTII
ncbi:SDR family oxidoreductase [Algoriphagus sp. SE2]|uniref:SDR family NAD(P)-dependent oxidoreductase n=1 Tax=Algoriphagus sp. SE2 TaxID=3141536 RepID=UPI0031CD7A3F